MDSLSIAIIGAAIAITMFFREKSMIDMKKELMAAGVQSDDGEEDFF